MTDLRTYPNLRSEDLSQSFPILEEVSILRRFPHGIGLYLCIIAICPFKGNLSEKIGHWVAGQ